MIARVRKMDLVLVLIGLENSMAEGYHSEKMYDAFIANSLLVYIGNPGGHYYLPKSDDGHPSFIDATLFSSPGALAKHLLYLANNPSAYQAYFSWRFHDDFTNFFFIFLN